jgi:N-acetyl-anhydromuramyl-L-alanine amidase AmpD
VGGRRGWAQISGITLHQTAVELGERPDRWKTLGAHLGVTREGQVLWLHGFEKIVWHANGFNNRTVGIEMDGMYEGVEGDPKTFWRPASEPDRKPQRPTQDLIDAAKATVRWVCQEVERHGGKVQHLLAHRQASEDRRSDPGSALWQAVGMALHRELGLDDGGAGFTDGTGLPIPEAWDRSRRGVRY